MWLHITSQNDIVGTIQTTRINLWVPKGIDKHFYDITYKKSGVRKSRWVMGNEIQDRQER